MPKRANKIETKLTAEKENKPLDASPKVTKIKVRKPTLKQKKLLETLHNNTLRGGSYKQALLDAGYSESTALQSTRTIESPTIQRLIMSADRVGMSDDWFIEKIRKGLEDNNPGNVVKFANLWARLRYSDAFKQKIDYNDNRQINVYEQYSNEDLERLANE